MTETDIRCKRRSHLEEQSNVEYRSAVTCEYKSPYKGPCESDALYQIWDENEIEEKGELEMLFACKEHTEEIKSKLHEIRTLTHE